MKSSILMICIDKFEEEKIENEYAHLFAVFQMFFRCVLNLN